MADLFKGLFLPHPFQDTNLQLHHQVILIIMLKCIRFINRHSNLSTKIGTVKRKAIPQFPPKDTEKSIHKIIL